MRQKIWTDSYERDDVFVPNWLDSEDFDAYCDAIERVISNADHALCTREIHDALGDRANRRWTADALSVIASIEEVGVQPTRYRSRMRPDLPLVIPQRDLNARLFAK